MSAPSLSTPGHTTPPMHGTHEASKFFVFVQLAMVLAFITGVEIIIIYLPFAKWLTVSSLVILSIVKFMLVIFIFMHLKWDKVFCTILFFIGLILAAATSWALLVLFNVEASLPLTNSSAIHALLRSA